MAVLRAIPKPPPIMACGSNAYLNIMANVAGIYCMRIISTITAPTINIPAMTGTIFSVTEASLLIPPRNINPLNITRAMPVIHVGTPKAVLMVEPMELD